MGEPVKELFSILGFTTPYREDDLAWQFTIWFIWTGFKSYFPAEVKEFFRF